jgi:hypothetical protein
MNWSKSRPFTTIRQDCFYRQTPRGMAAYSLLARSLFRRLDQSQAPHTLAIEPDAPIDCFFGWLH